MAGWLQLRSKRWWLSCCLIRKHFSPYHSVARLFWCSDRSMSVRYYPQFPHPPSAPALWSKLFSFKSIFAFPQHCDSATVERLWSVPEASFREDGSDLTLNAHNSEKTQRFSVPWQRGKKNRWVMLVWTAKQPQVTLLLNSCRSHFIHGCFTTWACSSPAILWLYCTLNLKDHLDRAQLNISRIKTTIATYPDKNLCRTTKMTSPWLHSFTLDRIPDTMRGMRHPMGGGNTELLRDPPDLLQIQHEDRIQSPPLPAHFAPAELDWKLKLTAFVHLTQL